jgi:hypothetical protein
MYTYNLADLLGIQTSLLPTLKPSDGMLHPPKILHKPVIFPFLLRAILFAPAQTMDLRLWEEAAGVKMEGYRERGRKMEVKVEEGEDGVMGGRLGLARKGETRRDP